MSPRPLRGVNLGGWLVVEKWITASLFAGTTAIDQYTLVRSPDGPARLRRHYESFIVEKDFIWLKQHNINAVRVPVGFWALSDEPPLMNVRKQLDWLFVMAQKYDIAVLLCMHAAPGSQNGRDHSGKVGNVEWYRAHNKAKTLHALSSVAERYSNHPNLWGVELLNEPQVINPWQYIQLLCWSRRASRQLQRHFEGLRVIYSDAFMPLLWTGRVPGVLDVHHYQSFSRADKRLTVPQHVLKVAKVATKIAKWQRQQPVIIGEWSLGLDGVSLQGAPRGENEEQFGTAQLRAYSGAAGWFFWNYKTEQSGGWNYRHLVERGVLSLPSSSDSDLTLRG